MTAIRSKLFAVLLAGLAAGCRPDAVPAPRARSAEGLALTLSTNRAFIGDAVKVQLSVDHPAGARVEWPTVADGKRLVVKDQATAANGATSSVSRWTLMSYELGSHSLWSGTVAIVSSDGTRSERRLPEASITVDSILPVEGDAFRPAKGLVRWPRPPMTRALLMIAAISLLALLLAWAVRLWLRRRTRAESRPVPPAPHERALRALQDLERRTAFPDADPELFFVEVSSIVRTYLEDRFSLRAPEQTTEEFIRAAASSAVLRLEHQHLVEAFLVECDLVKFARYRPGADRMRAALEAAYRLVRETMPVPEPAVPAGGAA